MRTAIRTHRDRPVQDRIQCRMPEAEDHQVDQMDLEDPEDQGLAMDNQAIVRLWGEAAFRRPIRGVTHRHRAYHQVDQADLEDLADQVDQEGRKDLENQVDPDQEDQEDQETFVLRRFPTVI